MSETDVDPKSVESVQDPPTRLPAIMRSIGPGLIVAGSIVGSGELIATTKTGAEAGFVLLWLILIGCVVKVFCQIEFGRYAIISGKTTLMALDEVPGPRFRGRGNWLVWYWLVMWLASISQLGGIVGGVGQSLAIAVPVTSQGRDYNAMAEAASRERLRSVGAARSELDMAVAATDDDGTAAALKTLRERYARTYGGVESRPSDAAIWAGIMAIATSLLLYSGRYGMIQSLSTVLVASFTLLTVGNLFLLQGQADFAVTAGEFLSGLKGALPEARSGTAPIATALATFGIIGVGAAELIVYPYWCLEKGYAKFVGPRPQGVSSSTRSESSELAELAQSAEPNDALERWTSRARGWMRVMQVDAWGAMAVYTFATIAFYLLGAGTLWRLGLNPEKDDMVRTLAVMYEPVFSQWASIVFLFGAFAVLYSTFFVANASHARTFSDCLRVIGVTDRDETTRRRWIRRLSVVFPLLCWVIYVFFPQPAKLVLISGIAQGVMLPMLAVAALYFRYRKCVAGLQPGKWWDAMLWISGVAMLVTGTWTVYVQFR